MVCHFTFLYKFGNRGNDIIKKTIIHDYYIMHFIISSD
jgi:hypothetical protein